MSKTVATARRRKGTKTEALPARRRFTVEEYYRMAEAGILGPDERTELLGGEIYVMAPMGSRHARCVWFASHWFERRLDDSWAIVRAQLPIRLSSGAEPEPDLVLARPRADGYVQAHPVSADVLLLIEIADSSLAYDRDLKMRVYAEAGIRDFWLVDLTSDRVLIHREPVASGYRSITIARRGDVLSPLAFPELQLPVADLLPG